MNLERAALVAEILGGFAVVVSVIYLALQISDNNRLLRSQSHYNALEVLQGPFEVMLENADLAELLQQCSEDPESVSELAWSRCTNYIFMQANGWEYTYYQNADNAVPKSLWVGVDGYFSNEARTKASWVRFWFETEQGFGEPFRTYLQNHILDNPAYSD
ncbi:hypothetical protein [Congregibacter sp.]|uniref:hypothetical protein n=1 Tax=Congregibacter sp. TaxID=2744308 RepID=UPI00385E45E7